MNKNVNLRQSLSFLAEHAQNRPQDVAVIDHGQSVPFSVFYQDVCRVRRFLLHRGLGDAALIAVESTRLYPQWLILLACESLGICTLSFARDEVMALEDVLCKADGVFCSTSYRNIPFRQIIMIDQPWFDKVRSYALDENYEQDYRSQDIPLRLVKTSGTTGTIKSMYQSAASHNYRLEHYQYMAGFNENSRLLLGLEFAVQSMHGYATACLRAGGACVANSFDDFYGTLQDLKISHFHMLPYGLEILEKRNAEQHYEGPGLCVLSGGGAVGSKLRSFVKERLNSSLIETYGTNEGGFICLMDENGEGTVLPGVTVEVVDEREMVLVGQQGRVRVKAPASVGTYQNAAPDQLCAFKDGWFYPGDVGILNPDGRLKLLGRSDRLVNIGGVKYDPAILEGKVKDLDLVGDSCLVASQEKSGEQVMSLYVVLQERAKKEETLALIKPLIPKIFQRTRIAFVKNIPRTSTGKVQAWKLPSTSGS